MLAVIFIASITTYTPPPSYNVNNSSNGFVYLIVAAIIVIPFLYRLWNRYQASKIVVDAPALLSRFSNGMKLEKISSGVINNYQYSLLMTQPLEVKLPQGGSQYETGQAVEAAIAVGHNMTNTGKVIMTLQLPVKSPVHIAAFGVADSKTHSLLDEELTSFNLEPASLEGDFPDYFSLYCNKDGQIDLREVLDPPTMAFLVDFCQREDWELFEDILYFAENNISGHKHGNNTPAAEDAQLFVDKALPVLLRMAHQSPTTLK